MSQYFFPNQAGNNSLYPNQSAQNNNFQNKDGFEGNRFPPNQNFDANAYGQMNFPPMSAPYLNVSSANSNLYQQNAWSQPTLNQGTYPAPNQQDSFNQTAFPANNMPQINMASMFNQVNPNFPQNFNPQAMAPKLDQFPMNVNTFPNNNGQAWLNSDLGAANPNIINNNRMNFLQQFQQHQQQQLHQLQQFQSNQQMQTP
ncbi:hypothetical protein CONCODRAFT_4031, partial [Conidiobolus coronatus NRRL 28638]